MLASATVVLASSSVTRKSLLENAGLAVETIPPRVDEVEIRESMIADGADGADIAAVLAEQKARSVSRGKPGSLVIGADQILECDGKIYGKPVDRPMARDQLETLRGKDHQLISCVCVVQDGERQWHHLDRARLAMRNFSGGFAEAYLDSIGTEAFDGPGSYRIEGLGAQLFSRISGDYFTILGLPLLPLLEYLRTREVLTS